MWNTLKLGLTIVTIALIGALALVACDDPTSSVSGCAHAWTSYVQTVDPACETGGVETRTCTLCGITDAVTLPGEPALEHDWDYAPGATLATCIADGHGTRICQRPGCGIEETGTLDALGHRFNEEDYALTAEPTCMTTGTETAACARAGCTETDIRTIPIDPDNHLWDDTWQETTAPTTAADGVETRTCQRAGCAHPEIRAIPMLYLITMLTEGDGTAEASPNPAGPGATVSITATADSGNMFVAWEVLAGEVTLSSAVGNPATFTMPGSAVTIQALFAEVLITVTVTNNTRTYNGASQSATVVYSGEYNTANAGALTISYTDAADNPVSPVNAGTYSIMVSTAGGTAYDAITVPILVGTLVINPKQLSWATNSGRVYPKEYDGTTDAVIEVQPTLNGIESVDAGQVIVLAGTVAFSSKNVRVLPSNGMVINQDALGTGYGITGPASANYNAPTARPTFAGGIISRKPITMSGVAAVNRSYDGTTTVAISGGTLVDVIIGDDVTAIVPSTGSITNADAGNDKPVTIDTITLSGADFDNYTLTQPTGITVNITTATGAAVAAPTVDGTPSGTSITINAVTAPGNGQTVEYGIHTANSATAATWQTGLTFSGLTQETNYFIFARSAANTNYNAGTPSVALPATTAAPPPEYVITGSDTTFTATRGGVTITGADGVTIQNAINAIRTNAAGNDCTIQFGDGTTAIITPAASDFSGSSWGNIILTGKLTSQSFAITINNNIGPGTITIDSAAEITSNIIVIDNVSSRSIIVNGGRLEATSDSSAIRNQSNGSVTIEGGIVSSVNGNVITNISTGTITINGGRLETTGNDAIWNILSGSVTINGGTVSAVNGNAITNSSTGTVTITGGRVEATGTNSRAIDSTGAGLITISGDVWDNEAGTGTLVTSANAAATDANRGTIHVANIASNTAERLRITGGTVSNTSTGAAIWNLSGGTINISGGMVQAATGNAIFSNNGLITITGDLWEGTNKTGTLITSANPGNTASVIAAATGGTIRIMGVDVNHIGLTITGGTVSNTAADGGVTSNGIAVFQSRGRMNIIDGRVEAANGSAIRFGGGGAGEVSISGDSTVVIGGGITIIIDSDGGIRDGVASILGGKVETTNPGVPVIQAINFTQTHIVLGGNPEITGGTGIQVAGAGATNRIRVSSSFAPSADRTYVLNPNGTPTPGTGRVAVQDGAPHFARFARHSSVTATLAVSGNNIIWQ